MTAATDTKNPVMIPSLEHESGDHKRDRSGWIVVLVAAALVATLAMLSHRFEPRALPDAPEALLD